MSTSPFAYAICQPGSERWLKAEIARLLPHLHPGLQRPGLVTFKTTSEPVSPDAPPASAFARAWGCSAGPAHDVAGIAEVARRVGATRLLLGARDQGPPERLPPARQAAADAEADALRAAVVEAHPFTPGPPTRGDVVLDVMTSPDEPALVGWHTHLPGCATAPCGRWPHSVPPDAPSRAYSKITEGIAWSGARVRSGDLALEIGASPGGGTLALLDHGAFVVAVDPLPLDAAIAARPEVVSLRKAAREVTPADLPGPVSWLVCDASLPADELLATLRRLVMPMGTSLRGLLLLVKVHDDRSAADLPRTLSHIEGLGFPAVRARQLPSCRREVFVAALRR